MNDDLQHILIGEVRALFGTGVMSMQVAFLIWGKDTTGHSGDWWKFVVLTVITLGIVAWSFWQSEARCKEWKKHLLAALAGLAVTWTAFSLIAIPLTYKVFIGIALALFLWSLVWGVFVVCTMSTKLRSLPEKLKDFIEQFKNGTSVLLLGSLAGGMVLAYSRFMDNDIRGWYVQTLPWVGFVVVLVLLLPSFKKLFVKSSRDEVHKESVD